MRKIHKYSKIANATKITKSGENRFYFYLLTGPLSPYSQVIYLLLACSLVTPFYDNVL